MLLADKKLLWCPFDEAFPNCFNKSQLSHEFARIGGIKNSNEHHTRIVLPHLANARQRYVCHILADHDIRNVDKFYNQIQVEAYFSSLSAGICVQTEGETHPSAPNPEGFALYEGWTLSGMNEFHKSISKQENGLLLLHLLNRRFDRANLQVTNEEWLSLDGQPVLAQQLVNRSPYKDRDPFLHLPTIEFGYARGKPSGPENLKRYKFSCTAAFMLTYWVSAQSDQVVTADFAANLRMNELTCDSLQKLFVNCRQYANMNYEMTYPIQTEKKDGGLVYVPVSTVAQFYRSLPWKALSASHAAQEALRRAIAPILNSMNEEDREDRVDVVSKFHDLDYESAVQVGRDIVDRYNRGDGDDYSVNGDPNEVVHDGEWGGEESDIVEEKNDSDGDDNSRGKKVEDETGEVVPAAMSLKKRKDGTEPETGKKNCPRCNGQHRKHTCKLAKTKRERKYSKEKKSKKINK